MLSFMLGGVLSIAIYGFLSWVYPDYAFRIESFDAETGEWKPIAEYNSDDYHAQRIYYAYCDTQEHPVRLVHRGKVVMEGTKHYLLM